MNMETYDPNACPKCLGRAFNIADRYSDTANIWQYLACDDCGCRWTEEYALTSVWVSEEDN